MENLFQKISSRDKKLAILIDPDKTNEEKTLIELVEKIKLVKPSFIFVGGSTVSKKDLESCLLIIKEQCEIPVIIFPGSHQQISDKADGILFLSLLSGRNPDYLIGHQIESAHLLKQMDIEAISTAYLLVDGGKSSSVA